MPATLLHCSPLLTREALLGTGDLRFIVWLRYVKIRSGIRIPFLGAPREYDSVVSCRSQSCITPTKHTQSIRNI